MQFVDVLVLNRAPYHRNVAVQPKKPARTTKVKRGSKPAGRSKQETVAEAAGSAAGEYLRDQRIAIEQPSAAAPASRRRSAADPLVSKLRHQLLPLLILHFIDEGPTYGNQLIDRVTELTGGVLTVNPNTMYPLLRDFEQRGLIEGQWEHPERRSRRFYSLTAEGEAELAKLRPGARIALDLLGETLSNIRETLYG